MNNLIYTISKENHTVESIKEILNNHPEIKFASFVGIDLSGNDTDEKIPIKLFLDDIARTDTIIVPQGEDWDTYSFIDGKTKKELPAGKHVLKVAITGSYVNLDWILFAKDLLPSTIPSVHSSWNSAVSQNAALHIYNLQGAHLGSFSMSDGLTKELLISKMHSSNYKPGVYFVRSGNGSINKMIELKK